MKENSKEMTALEDLISENNKFDLECEQEILKIQTCNLMNERITEDIVRDILKANKINYQAITLEEQKSKNPRIDKLLKNASKHGKGGGKPEFIITFDEVNDLIIIIECKADVRKHQSENLNKYDEYAVDGVLLYSSYLSKEFDVISVAVSGQSRSELKVSNFLQLKKNASYQKLKSESILSFQDYVNHYRHDPEKEKLEISKLMKYSKKLHNDLRDFAKLSEQEKPLLVSAVLIALKNDSFVSSYSKKQKQRDLAKLLISTIKEELEHVEIPQKKIESMLAPYRFIENHPVLTKEKDKNGKPVTLLLGLIKDIEENVKPFSTNYTQYDVLGQFYGEFLRYTAGDKKWLGIVITPKHVTELFIELADVKKNHVVFDNCCGSAGFLISAMKRMVDDAKDDTDEIDKIKRTRLIGVEILPNMFALACANMILRGDGKANIYRDDCFSISDTIKKNHKCTVGFLNPPYSQKGDDQNELNFIANCLECLEQNSLCIAIVPMGCAIQPSQQKRDLLEKHTLEAVMSMPDQLFYPIGAVACIMVFRAKAPHNKQKNTWFGYWKEDGFVKTKNEGRIDKLHVWENIKKRWRDNFMNRKEIAGECVLQSVDADDEWCAEAYMQTDYSKITEKDFERTINDYAMFNVINSKSESI